MRRAGWLGVLLGVVAISPACLLVIRRSEDGLGVLVLFPASILVGLLYLVGLLVARCVDRQLIRARTALRVFSVLTATFVVINVVGVAVAANPCPRAQMTPWPADGEVAAISSSLSPVAPVLRLEALVGVNRANSHSEVVVTTERGELARLTKDGCTDAAPALSPDGQRLAYFRDGALQVASRDGTVRAVDDVSGFLPCIAWSPDGDRLAVSDVRPALRIIDLVGTNTRPRILPTEDRAVLGCPSWLDDGSAVAVPTDSGVFLHDSRTGRQVDAFPRPPDAIRMCLSPDGRWLAYTREPPAAPVPGVERRSALFVTDVRGGTGRRLLDLGPTPNRLTPRWSSTGRIVTVVSSDDGAEEDTLAVVDPFSSHVEQLTPEGAWQAPAPR